MTVTHLNKHVIDDKQKVDNFRGHDKDVETTGRLVESHTLKLAAELECSWKKRSVTVGKLRMGPPSCNLCISMTYLWLWSPV